MTAGTGTQLRSNGGGQSACMVGKCACSGRVVSIAIAAVLVTATSVDQLRAVSVTSDG